MKQQQPGQPDPKEFASGYASQVARAIEELQKERSEEYPLLTGQVGNTVSDRASNYA